MFLSDAYMSDAEAVAALRSHPSYMLSGKTRELLSAGNRIALSYASDRWSAFEFRLPHPIDSKGRVNNVTTVATKRLLMDRGIPNDLIAAGASVRQWLPAALRKVVTLIPRTTAIYYYSMVKYELIIRGYVLGSLARAVEAGETEFCGHVLPANLSRGQKLAVPLVTPTTKAAVGHDEAVDWRTVERQYPGITEFALKVFTTLSEHYATQPYGRLLDMKIEVAQPSAGSFVLCDELSPDSCRFCSVDDYEDLTAGKPVVFLDKEFGRQWLVAHARAHGLDIHALDPTSPDDIARVQALPRDPAFEEEFITRYERACQIMTGGLTSDAYILQHFNLRG